MKTSGVIFGAVVAAGLGIGGQAAAEDEYFTSFRALKPELALEAAEAALGTCRDLGYQVAVSVTDRLGVLQVTLRDQFAGAHTPDTAYRKAWTAASFRTETSELSRLTEGGEAWAIRNVTHALPLGGGIIVRAGDGDMIAAIGVSGAPTGGEDETCARAGEEAIADRIAF